MFKIKRIYDPAEAADSYRILVDRVWPRGLSKEKAGLDLWMKEIAPSDQLRKWFAHDPKRWIEFQERYQEELKDTPELSLRLDAPDRPSIFAHPRRYPGPANQHDIETLASSNRR
jgi:uncharacterized protein YeaO (DUF488 family)